MNKSRMLHTMLRVGDMQRSVEFYTNVMGMRILRTYEHAEENYSLTFLGYGEEVDTCVLELTFNYGVTHYDKGNAYGHIAIGVDNCERACATVAERGGKVTYGPTLMDGLGEIIAFVKDPDDYQIELVERPAERL